MTEDEARKKWCPFARLIATGAEGQDVALPDASAGFNRPTLGPPDDLANAACMASSCMAWRWDSRSRGHCGLAGAAPLYPADAGSGPPPPPPPPQTGRGV